MHQLIRAGIIATTEALGNFSWYMLGKHTAMHPCIDYLGYPFKKEAL
jgi:hypothetical protein